MNRLQNTGRNRQDEILSSVPCVLPSEENALAGGSLWETDAVTKPKSSFMQFYNPHTIYSLFIYYVFTKGMTAGVGILYLMQVSFCRKTLGVDARQCQIMGVIASVPWCLRGVIAVLLCRWKKKVAPSEAMIQYYKSSEALFIIVACILCNICLLFLALGTFGSVFSGVLLGGVNLGICVLDVIYSGVYSRLVNKGRKVREDAQENGKPVETNDHAKTLIFLSATSYQLGAVLAAATVGPTVEFFDPRLIFFVAAALVSTNLIPVFLDFLGEIDVSTVPEGDASFLRQYQRFKYVAILTGLLAVCNSTLSIMLQESHSLAAYAFLSLLILLAYNYSEFRVDTYDPNLTQTDVQQMLVASNENNYTKFYATGVTIILLQTALFGNIYAAEAYFLTERDNCPKSMPRFSYIDFNTVGAIISAVSGWVGIQVFRRFFTDYSLRQMFVTTTWLQICIRSIRALMPLGLFQTGGGGNWPFFVVVYCILGPMVTYIYTMPSLMLVPHMIPPEFSTVGFATMVSLQSYSRVAAIQFGLLAIELSDLQEHGSCDFCNLWLIQIGTQVGLPLLCIPLLYTFMPKTKL